MRKEGAEYYQHGPLGVWRNKNAAGALTVLTGDDFCQLRLAEVYDDIATSFGRDFKNIRFVSQHMPLFHDGVHHKKLRKLAAVYLQEVADALKAFEDDAAQLVESLFLQKGPHELISELVIPIMEKLSYALTELEYSPGLIAIMSGNNSLKATLKIEETFARINAQAKARFPDESDEKRGVRLVFATLGADPLGAALARSFDALFAGMKNQPIAELNWAPQYAATGPSTAIRQCKHAPVNLSDAAQDVAFFEVDFDPFLEDEGATRNHIFGVGAHACVGRGLALSLWAQVIEGMKSNPFNITYVSSAPTSHKFLNFPSALHIEVLK